MELPEDAHQWRKLLTQVSIVPDNISSMVHGYGLRLLTKQGWHGAYDTFCERKEPYVITMENMKGIIGVQAVGEKAFVHFRSAPFCGTGADSLYFGQWVKNLL